MLREREREREIAMFTNKECSIIDKMYIFLFKLA